MCILDRQQASVSSPAPVRSRKHRVLPEVGSGHGRGIKDKLLQRSLTDNRTAHRSRTWSDINDMVSGPHHFFVMLDDEHRVA